MSSEQYGFRKDQSTEDAVSQLTSKIAASKAHISIFLDVSKAFDTVSILILLEKFDSQFGIRGVALEWFGAI